MKSGCLFKLSLLRTLLLLMADPFDTLRRYFYTVMASAQIMIGLKQSQSQIRPKNFGLNPLKNVFSQPLRIRHQDNSNTITGQALGPPPLWNHYGTDTGPTNIIDIFTGHLLAGKLGFHTQDAVLEGDLSSLSCHFLLLNQNVHFTSFLFPFIILW